MKIRVLATHSRQTADPVPALVYRAEAYDAEDAFRRQKWACSHLHDNPHAAYECGTEWLESDREMSTPDEVG